ncbi:hypothetical protein [Lactobacillus acetotolerans]|uniref:hypothetical protein n=1 Tax=Lactobacillus acetotolerans TaxID=1600 RepID=UPI002FDB8E00
MADYNYNEVNKLPEIIRELRDLDKYRVEAGVLLDVGGKGLVFLQMIATVNEFGTQIKAKNGGSLAIPTKLAKGKRPADFGNKLFIPKGKSVLAMSNGTGLDVYFILRKSVNIPERSFLRTAIDNHLDKLTDLVAHGIQEIIAGNMTAMELYKRLGDALKLRIKANIVEKMNPHNAPLTIANKGKDDPLVDTGSLLKSISYRVISNEI